VSTDKTRSPAARVMDEAIELAIEERSPYPEKAAFVDADEPHAGAELRRAADEGRAVVLVYADGDVRTLLPDLASPTACHPAPGKHDGTAHAQRSPQSG
jgi:hypothetical protein